MLCSLFLKGGIYMKGIKGLLVVVGLAVVAASTTGCGAIAGSIIGSGARAMYGTPHQAPLPPPPH